MVELNRLKSLILKFVPLIFQAMMVDAEFSNILYNTQANGITPPPLLVFGALLLKGIIIEIQYFQPPKGVDTFHQCKRDSNSSTNSVHKDTCVVLCSQLAQP